MITKRALRSALLNILAEAALLLAGIITSGWPRAVLIGALGVLLILKVELLALLAQMSQSATADAMARLWVRRH